MMNNKLILASKSPRRKQLLELVEIDFDIITKETDESYPGDLEPDEVAKYIALKKAKDIQADYPDRRILAADTIVVLGNQIIGKPADREDAIRILNQLAGRKHTVITGVVLIQGDDVISFSESTEVEFHWINQTDIEYYIDRYQPYDKAGAYAIQEWIGGVAIKRINGCFYNVMGLPISRLFQQLKHPETSDESPI